MSAGCRIAGCTESCEPDFVLCPRHAQASSKAWRAIRAAIKRAALGHRAEAVRTQRITKWNEVQVAGLSLEVRAVPALGKRLPNWYGQIQIRGGCFASACDYSSLADGCLAEHAVTIADALGH